MKVEILEGQAGLIKLAEMIMAKARQDPDAQKLIAEAIGDQHVDREALYDIAFGQGVLLTIVMMATGEIGRLTLTATDPTKN